MSRVITVTNRATEIAAELITNPDLREAVKGELERIQALLDYLQTIGLAKPVGTGAKVRKARKEKPKKAARNGKRAKRGTFKKRRKAVRRGAVEAHVRQLVTHIKSKDKGEGIELTADIIPSGYMRRTAAALAVERGLLKHNGGEGRGRRYSVV